MFQFLAAPVRSNLDFYESARLRLTWMIHLLLVMALTPLIVVSLYDQPFYAGIYAIALMIILISLVLIKRTGNFQFYSIIASCILFLMVLYSMFRLDGYVHFIEPFWLLVLVIYIYFIHGNLGGGIAIIVTVLSTVIFLLFFLNTSINNIRTIDFYQSLSMGFEFTICLSLVGYILHQYIFLKNHTELELKKINNALILEKELVENRNQEKTIMLQEIHHRVKNNLQIVMSMLRMQASKIESDEAKEHFADAINRVFTMSLIHQRLYESDNLSAIDFSGYLEALSADILKSSPQSKQIKKELFIEVKEIGMKSIVPIALIITELISNSAKHAFSTIDDPKITLRVNEGTHPGAIEMHYSDNGVWKSSTNESFGMHLIEALTEQLDGSYEFGSSEEGTWFQFVFATAN